ncbi:MAG: secretin N-terminal domain-containing protein [Verrucomicrobiota bacterium]
MNSNTLLRRLNCASSTRVARTSRLLKFSIVLLALTLTGVTSPAASTAGASPAAPRATAPSDNADSTNKVEMVFRKSVFQDDSKSGKDPFFPRSSRRGPHVVASTEVVAPANVIVAPSSAPIIISPSTEEVTAAHPALTAAEGSEDVVPLIQIDEAPLPDAIRTLARQANLNFQFDPKILNLVPDATGKVPAHPTVSFRWENVTAMEALLALLENYNLQIVKDPKTKIARVTLKDSAALAPLQTRVFQLDYANPTNLVTILTNTISSRGRVVADIRTSQLVISATEKELEAVEALLTKLDTQTKQILIEARFIEVNHNPRTSKGVDWTDTLSKQNITFGNGITTGTTSTTTPVTTSTGTTPGGRPTSTTGSSVASTFNTLVGGTTPPGISANTMSGLNPSTFFLNADGVKVALSFLNSDADAESIATPRAVTLENVATELSVVRNIPVFEQQQGANTGGSVSPNTVKPNYLLAGPNNTILNEIGIKLLVTPRIFGTSNVFLDLKPEISDRELKPETVVLNNQESSSPIFSRRKLTTQAMIPSGYTLVLGGLRQDNSSKSFTKVPLFGDLPGIGLLFRKDEKSRDKRDLVIFVTPTIIRGNDFQAAPDSADFLHQSQVQKPEEKWTAWDTGRPVDWNKPIKPQYFPTERAE